MIKSEEVLPWNEYEKIRKDRIAKIVELKKERRIELGDRMSILFENKDTVLHQIQEMVYLDRLSSEKDREHEIEVYKKTGYLVEARLKLPFTFMLRIILTC